MIAALVFLLVVYAVIWAAAVSLWAVELGMVCGSIGGVLLAVFFAAQSNFLPGAAVFGIVLVYGGIFILLFFGCVQVTKGVSILTKKMFHRVKALFIRERSRVKKGIKKWFIVAFSNIAVGFIIFIAAFSAMDFDFSKFSTQKYRSNIYE